MSVRDLLRLLINSSLTLNDQATETYVSRQESDAHM
jgi:hypothetical protein